MIIFSIELSTICASIAICDDDRVLAEESWIEPQARHQRLFEVTPQLLKRAGVDWPKIDLFAVGRGPGAFSGIRIGLMASQMFAMPGGKKTIAVSSGDALALQIEGGNVVICGDARRGTFWYGIRRGDTPCEWKFCKAEEWAGVISTLGPDKTITAATSQWDRLELLRKNSPANVHWIEGDQYPTARSVAKLALARTESETLEPIYLHPPV